MLRRGNIMRPNLALLLAIGLALSSSSAWAQAPCDAAALNGRYVFTGRGFIEAVQPGIQRLHYGVFVFDGAGKLTGKQSSSRGGKIGREKLEGSYTLDADCTGTLTLGGILAGQTHWDLYLRTGSVATSFAWTRAIWPYAVFKDSGKNPRPPMTAGG